MKSRLVFRMIALTLCIGLAAGLVGGCASNTNKKKKIGVSLYYKGDEWYVNVDAEFKKLGAEHGYEMIVMDANGTPETQKQQLENFVAQKCDMIMFCAVDPEGIATTLDEIDKKGVPIVAFDEPPVWDKTVSFVAWDNKETGIQLGDYVKKYITDNMGGKANIVVYELAQSPLCMSRAEGFLEVMGTMPDVKIVTRQDPENSEEKAANMTANIKEPFDIVFAVTDPGAFGAVATLEANKVQGVKVFSCGGYGDKTFQLLENKDPYYQACVVVPPVEMVKACMSIADNYFAGKTSEIPKQVNSNFTIVDSTNIAQVKP